MSVRDLVIWSGVVLSLVFNKLADKDSLSSAYLSSLQGEMEHRVAYLRRYADSLTHEERRQQLDNLDRLERILDKFSESSAVTPPLPEVQIDDPVRQLIENE